MMRIDEIVLGLTTIFSLIAFLAQVISLGFPPLSFFFLLFRLLILGGWCTAMFFAFIYYIFAKFHCSPCSPELDNNQILIVVGVVVLNGVALFWAMWIVPIISQRLQARATAQQAESLQSR